MGWESPDSVTSEKYAEERKDSGAVPPWRCILVWGVAPYTSLVVSTSACTLERARSFDTFRWNWIGRSAKEYRAPGTGLDSRRSRPLAARTLGSTGRSPPRPRWGTPSSQQPGVSSHSSPVLPTLRRRELTSGAELTRSSEHVSWLSRLVGVSSAPKLFTQAECECATFPCRWYNVTAKGRRKHQGNGMTARNTSFLFGRRMEVFFSQEITAFNAEGGMGVLTTRQD